MLIKIKPLSVNQVWKGRRFKTSKYKSYEKELKLLLPPIRIDFKKDLRIDITFGFSSASSDIDNPLKPLIDVLQRRYDFDDKQIYELNVKKKLVKKGNEFIELQINELCK